MGICWSSSSPPNDPTPTPTPTATPIGTSHAQYSKSTTTCSGSYNRNTTTTTTTISGSSGGGNSSSINSKFSVSTLDTELASSINVRVFTFAELKKATKNFNANNLLGEGGFGKVFRGFLELTTTSKNSGGSTVVAVKKLNVESLQELEEWQSEINFLGCLSHPNILKLLGYCYEKSELLLVYEYMQKRSLQNHLFGRGSAIKPLSWDIRLQIAIGAARGISFLHTSDKGIIHRDLKASHILLDGSYNAKISDFGLAKLGPSAGQSHVTKRVMGTYGYAAPEYMQTGQN